jgi:hypothetical protein
VDNDNGSALGLVLAKAVAAAVAAVATGLLWSRVQGMQ